MPAWLGWIAVVLLSLYLAIYPMLGCGPRLDVRAEHAARAGPRPGRRLGDHRMASRRHLHRLRVEPGRRRRSPTRTCSMLTATRSAPTACPPLVVLAGGLIWLAGSSPMAAARASSRRHPGRCTSCRGRSFHRAGPSEARSASCSRTSASRTSGGPGFSEIAAQRLAQLSMQPGGARPRLLFWPEAAVTNPMQDERSEPYGAFAAFERARAASIVGPGEYLLTGGIALLSKDEVKVSGAANSVFVFGQGGRLVGRYDKAHLVPYGEYLPMRPLLSSIGLSRLAPGDVDFISGPGPRTVDLPGLGQGRVPALLRDHLLGRSRRPPQPARFHLQSVERRLVRPLGPAAASRPGAAARRRRGASGDPLDADRDQRR